VAASATKYTTDVPEIVLPFEKGSFWLPTAPEAGVAYAVPVEVPVGPVGPAAPVAPATLISQSVCVPLPDVDVTLMTKEVPEYDVTFPKKQAAGVPELHAVAYDKVPAV
jgi:hypothetical protein